MPRPTPDYIPKEVVDKAAALGLKPQAYAIRLGFSENRFYSFFGSTHSKLKPYLILCEAGNISLDELVLILEAGQFAKFIDKLLESQATNSIPTLARRLGISPPFIYERIKTPGVNGLGTYLKMAKALDLTVEEMARICLR